MSNITINKKGTSNLGASEKGNAEHERDHVIGIYHDTWYSAQRN